MPASSMSTAATIAASAAPIGIMAATTLPSVTSSTMIATTTPSPSTRVSSGRWIEKTSPPTLTVDPGRVSVNFMACSVRSARCSSVNVETVPSTRTRMRACR